MFPPLVGLTTGPTALWYLTRGTGIVALVLLTAVMVLGVLATMAWTSERWPRFVSQAVHRNLSLFCLVLIGVHIATTVADGFAPVGFLDAFIPFRSPYRPIWLGLGALSFDILIVVGITSGLRHRIGYRAWRGIHWMAYASWPVAVLHGLGSGTDAARGPVLLVNALCIAAVLGAVGWRLVSGWPAQVGSRLAGGAAASVFTIAAATLVVLGPLRPGWARRAGTPASLVAGKTASPSATASAGRAPRASIPSSAAAQSPASGSGSNTGTLPGAPFSSALSGSITTSQPDASNQVTVTISGRLSGGANLAFQIVLGGTPEGSGVSLTSGQVSLGSAQGSVTGLQGGRILATVSSGSTSVNLVFHLTIDQSTGQVQGTVVGS